MTKTALIVGAGFGISASFARLLAKNGYRVALASRDTAKLNRLANETNAITCACDAADPTNVVQLFAHIGQHFLSSMSACSMLQPEHPGLSMMSTASKRAPRC